MKQLLFIFLLFVFIAANPGKAEAKIWTKDLVDSVVLDSGYKLSLCTIDATYDRAGEADNVFNTLEQKAETNPDSITCNKESSEDILFANITLNFNKANWGEGSAPEKLIQFQNTLYAVGGYGAVWVDENSPSAKNDISPIDWFATMPGIRGIRGDMLTNTNPSTASDPQTLPNSHFLIIHGTDGKFVTALFAFNNKVYKLSSIISQVTEKATLVDYTKPITITPQATP